MLSLGGLIISANMVGFRSGLVRSGPDLSMLSPESLLVTALTSKEDNKAARKRAFFSKDENTMWAKFLASPAAAAASANLTSGDLIDLKGAAKNLWRQGVWRAATAQQLGASRAPAQRDA